MLFILFKLRKLWDGVMVDVGSLDIKKEKERERKEKH
jgi:hypothetical protein